MKISRIGSYVLYIQANTPRAIDSAYPSVVDDLMGETPQGIDHRSDAYVETADRKIIVSNSTLFPTPLGFDGGGATYT